MLTINWMLGYGNSPYVIVEDAFDLFPREECEFTFKNGLWYHIQENGLVRYMAHSGQDRNEGGFGGARFEILHNGERKILAGPWSSRASAVNTVLPAEKQIADIRLDNGRNYPMHVGILVSKLVELWDQDAYLLRAKKDDEFGVKGEQGAVTCSMEPNRLIKPDGHVFDRATDLEIFAEPVKR